MSRFASYDGPYLGDLGGLTRSRLLAARLFRDGRLVTQPAAGVTTHG